MPRKEKPRPTPTGAHPAGPRTRAITLAPYSGRRRDGVTGSCPPAQKGLPFRLLLMLKKAGAYTAAIELSLCAWAVLPVQAGAGDIPPSCEQDYGWLSSVEESSGALLLHVAYFRRRAPLPLGPADESHPLHKLPPLPSDPFFLFGLASPLAFRADLLKDSQWSQHN